MELSALSGYARVLIRARRRETPACGKEPLWSQDQLCGRAHLARQYAASWIERLGALLREREVTGRDASLPAPLLIFPLEWSPVKQLGRCPKPHKGRCPLTLQGALPLDPFLAARLELTSLLLLFRRFFCLFLRLFLLIQGFFPIKHLPHLPLRFLHHPISFLNRVLLRVVINLRPE